MTTTTHSPTNLQAALGVVLAHYTEVDASRLTTERVAIDTWLCHLPGRDRCARLLRAADGTYQATELQAVRTRSEDWPIHHCQCGAWSGSACEWSGPESDIVVVEYMPAHHRASHTAAVNRGVWPHNGASRIRVSRECAAQMIETDGEWCSVVGGVS